MKLSAAYALLATVASAVSTAKAIPDGPKIFAYDLGGVPVPVVPAIIGILATILVRVIVVTSPGGKKPLRIYNVAVTCLAALGSVVFISDHSLGPGKAFWVGIGCGAAGVTIVEIAKSQFGAAAREGLKTVFQVLYGSKPPS